ncbi:MAG TPA: archease [Elusimicrobiota bacterium]|nr:archease [Elusimicrobiota bacterium]
MPPPFEFFDHTADIGLIARGRDLPELFLNAARGLNALVLEPSASPPVTQKENIRLKSSDRDALLVQWLNELIFRLGVRRQVLWTARAFSVGDGVLVAAAEWETFDPARRRVLREVKSATYHELEIVEILGGWEARVVLDV